MVKIDILSIFFVDAACLGFSKSHFHLLRLLYHGCGKRCVCFTILHVVCSNPNLFSFQNIIDIATLFKIQRLPFDWRTPTGYFLAIVIQYIQTCYTFLFATSALSLGIGMYFIGNAIIKDICASLNAIDDNAKFDGNRMQIIDQISDFIETHSCVLELSAMRFLLFSPIF